MKNTVINKPTEVILHCAATPDFLETDDKFDSFGLSQIDTWHRGRGFDSCGYHAVIRRPGTIEFGRAAERIGAHTLGKNQNTLGVCYIGTMYPTKKQVISLLNLYVLFYKDFGITWESWTGHNEYDNKKLCPGFSMIVFRQMLENYHNLVLKTDPKGGVIGAK